ncbi:TrkH family potassium uptake protein [Desulfosarcina sp.]|uniref:TrkH family potassium uptake protein n=1 Tax=Desulfosarcina sp. TaxID=2027861 RepID=UPI00397111A0
MTLRTRILKLHPATLVLASFLLAIALGTVALKLPIATKAGHILWVDALFTATSAVCVTGLIVVDTGSYFTVFGQCTILAMIQIGGLGVMTISVTLFQWLGRSISFRQRMALQDLFAHTPREDIFGLVKSIILFTIGAEVIGAVLLSLHWSREFPIPGAIYMAVFHSVSAFCNAGFALFSDSMMGYSGNILLNMTVCGLIVVGGIGFPVLYDLQCWARFRKRQRCKLTIQTKTVLLTTLLLIVSGAMVFALLERRALGDTPSLAHGILAPLFQSITCRTAGFNTVDIASLKDATLAMMIFLMFFGASPGSCGGGVKTTTLALLAAFTFSRVRRKRRVNMFKKSIPPETVTRSVSLVLVSIAIIGTVLFLILVHEPLDGNGATGPRASFLAYFFETVSAFGTVGLSMGVTPALNTWGKCWITLTMIIGRVGVLTFAYIIAGTRATKGVEHAEENLMIG